MNDYKHWSCQMMNMVDESAGCECGMNCHLPVPEDHEIRALQTDLPSFERWFDAKDREARRVSHNRAKSVAESAEAETRMMIYRALKDSLTDEQVRIILNGDVPAEQMTESKAHEWHMAGRLTIQDKPHNPLNEDEAMTLISWGRGRLGLGADAFELAICEFGTYRCPVCARFDEPSCATEC